MRFSPWSFGALIFLGGPTECVPNLLAAAAATCDWKWFERHRPSLAPISPKLMLCYIAERVLGSPKSY